MLQSPGHLATERPCVLALTLINSQLFLFWTHIGLIEERQTALVGELFISIYLILSNFLLFSQMSYSSVETDTAK